MLVMGLASTIVQVYTEGMMPCRPFSHIPWRDSPLTRWMKENLITSSIIWVLASVSSSPDVSAQAHTTSQVQINNKGKTKDLQD